MPPRIAPAVPIAPATFANDPGRCGIRTRIVMLYEADGWRARSPGDWSTIALSRIRSGSVRRKHRTRGRGWARPRPSRTMAPVHHAADRVAHAVLPLTLLAVAAAPVAPSATVAARSDVLLAALVALTALGIEPRRLEVLRRRPAAVLALSAGPLAVLVPVAWAIGRLFDGPTRDGVLALGVAPTEVAAVGLVALAAADAVLALAAVAGSLVVSAAAGPVVLAAVGGSADVALGPLLGRFALVVSRRSRPGSPRGRRCRRWDARSASTPPAARWRSRRSSTPRSAARPARAAASSCRRRSPAARSSPRPRRSRSSRSAVPTTPRPRSAWACATSRSPPRRPAARSARERRSWPASTA